MQHIRALRLADGQRLELRAVVNAAGAWARPVAQWLGIDLPVFGKRRTVFHFTCPEALPGCPLLIDPSGIWLRPEGTGFIAAMPPEDGTRRCTADPTTPLSRTTSGPPWPSASGFEALRAAAWAGYYEMNAFDHNAILGLPPGLRQPVLRQNGFSGHGLQQCPAIGRGLAEPILTGRWQTLTWSPGLPAPSTTDPCSNAMSSETSPTLPAPAARSSWIQHRAARCSTSSACPAKAPRRARRAARRAHRTDGLPPEGGAAMMAEAHGSHRAARRASVTRGPGATNAAAGVHIAMQDSTPMVLFVGQIERARGARGLPGSGLPRCLRPAGLAGHRGGRRRAARQIVARAFSVAAAGARPGGGGAARISC